MTSGKSKISLKKGTGLKASRPSAANKPSKSETRQAGSGIKKKYLKSSQICKVTFTLPKEAAPNARTVTIVGDFNNWDRTSSPMKALKNGNYAITIDLPAGEYRYRYLIDDARWENDWYADKYVPNSFGCDNSVVIV